jgi:hypothetical protein
LPTSTSQNTASYDYTKDKNKYLSIFINDTIVTQGPHMNQNNMRKTSSRYIVFLLVLAFFALGSSTQAHAIGGPYLVGWEINYKTSKKSNIRKHKFFRDSNKPLHFHLKQMRKQGLLVTSVAAHPREIRRFTQQDINELAHHPELETIGIWGKQKGSPDRNLFIDDPSIDFSPLKHLKRLVAINILIWNKQKKKDFRLKHLRTLKTLSKLKKLWLVGLSNKEANILKKVCPFLQTK